MVELREKGIVSALSSLKKQDPCSILHKGGSTMRRVPSCYKHHTAPLNTKHVQET
jgi:hypothetical protein